MIIWINGAFGAGKTTTAYELHNRLLEQSFLFDPERIGYFIRNHYPSHLLKGDFQNIPLWRELTYRYLLDLSGSYNKPIIVPMTVVNEIYFKEIISKLRENNVEVHHFTILASKETLLRRLRTRGNNKNSWAAQQIDRCVSSLEQATFAHHIYSDHLLPEQIVDYIAVQLDLQLKADNRSKLKKAFDRLILQIKQK